MPDRPNVLILMTDQQRGDCLSCAGHPQLRTPNMDRLAAEGMRFTHACTVSPLSMPARASFLSGMYVHNHNMWTNAGELAPDEESLFGRLRDAGYRTAHVGKAHYYAHGGLHMREREGYMRARGFEYVHETTGPWATCNTDSYMTDAWEKKGLLRKFRDDYDKRRKHDGIAVWPSPLPVEDFMDSYIGRQGVRFIDEHDGDRPFALFVGFGGPHEPWDAPGEYAEMYDPEETPPAIGPAEPGGWVPDHAAERQRRMRVKGMSADDVRRLRANYYGKIALIDRWFGEILAACERKGVLDDTLVVFWSDHGEMAGDHGLLHKSRFFESSLRVPLVIRWPGQVESGATSPDLALTVDIAPTVLEAAGVRYKARLQRSGSLQTRPPTVRVGNPGIRPNAVPQRRPLETPPVMSAAVGDAACNKPRRMLGRSLWPVLRDPSARVRDAAFSEIAHAGRRNLMVRTDRYKYAMHEDGEGYMLHDLAEDPDERRNLIGHPDFKGIEAEMRDRLLRFLAEAQFVMRNP